MGNETVVRLGAFVAGLTAMAFVAALFVSFDLYRTPTYFVISSNANSFRATDMRGDHDQSVQSSVLLETVESDILNPPEYQPPAIMGRTGTQKRRVKTTTGIPAPAPSQATSEISERIKQLVQSDAVYSKPGLHEHWWAPLQEQVKLLIVVVVGDNDTYVRQAEAVLQTWADEHTWFVHQPEYLFASLS